MKCSGKTAVDPGSEWVTLDVSGTDRKYIMHVPPGYDPSRATPLVLTFHGFTSNAQEQIDYPRLGEACDQRGFLLISPQGTGIIPGWNAGSCCGEASILQANDVGFVRAILDKVREDFCVDERRIFASGMSNGAFFSHRVACEFSEEIAAIGAVSGGLMYKKCNPTRPVSILAFHGTNDKTVPYGGGTLMGFGPIEETIAFWVEHNGCAGEAQATYQKGEVTCTTHASCNEGTEVTFCKIDGESGTHSWPGAAHHPVCGDANQDIDATSTILDFFEKHLR